MPLVTFDQQIKKQKQHGQFTLSYRGYPDHFLAHRIFRLQRRSDNSHLAYHRYHRHSIKGHPEKPDNQIICGPKNKAIK